MELSYTCHGPAVDWKLVLTLVITPPDLRGSVAAGAVRRLRYEQPHGSLHAATRSQKGQKMTTNRAPQLMCAREHGFAVGLE
jgi:hypothetical protein